MGQLVKGPGRIDLDCEKRFDTSWPRDFKLHRKAVLLRCSKTCFVFGVSKMKVKVTTLTIFERDIRLFLQKKQQQNTLFIKCDSSIITVLVLERTDICLLFFNMFFF